MNSPHEVVADAARLARMLADQAKRAGEPSHADYFKRVATDADRRVERLRAHHATASATFAVEGAPPPAKDAATRSTLARRGRDVRRIL